MRQTTVWQIFNCNLGLGELLACLVGLGLLLGVFALELGHVLARAGASVTMLEYGERPLLRHDADQVAELDRIHDAIGIDRVLASVQ